MTRQTQTPTDMRAAAISTPGGPDVLVESRRPVPTPGAGEILVRVTAAGINRPDLLQRKGLYPPPPGASDIPGLEIAGTVIAHGPDIPNNAPPIGTRVCALLSGGGYAEYAVVPVGQTLSLPDTISDIQGAAIPETLFTVYQNLIVRGRMMPNETILIHGGTSGIGTMAIQMIKHCRPRGGGDPLRQNTDSSALWAPASAGATSLLIVTCGSDEKCTAALNIGATHAINYKTDDFTAEVARITHNRGVDIVLDMIGGDYVPRNLACLAYGGRHISIATMGGVTAPLDLRLLMKNNLTLTGGTLRPRSVPEKTTLRDAILRNIWPGVLSGTIAPVIHGTFPLADAALAHAALERGDVVGKIVLTI
jgi:NADPH2:quinone reductase